MCGSYTRLSKKVQPSGGALVTTDYINGFQYENNSLKFFHQPEGFVEYKNNQYIYNYIYKDHLGNNRLVYADLNKDGVINPANEIIEENNYYPFGLKHKGYNELATENPSGYKYKFGGKELNNELGLDLYDFGARNYDPALGRWLNVDPLAENSRRWTPYNYAYNNPIYFVDPDGMQAIGSIFDSYGRDLVSVGAIASLPTGSGEAYWENFIDEDFESQHADGEHDPPVGGNDRPFGQPNYEQKPNNNISYLVPLYPNGRPDFVGGYPGQALDELITAGIQWLGGAITNADVSKETSENLQVATSLAIVIASKGKNSKAGADVVENVVSRKIPTITEQAADLSKKINKNSVTIGTSTKQIRYDLTGRAHGSVPTPHKQVYNKNFVNGIQKNVSRASKEAVPMTQQEIRMVRKYIEKLNKGN